MYIAVYYKSTSHLEAEDVEKILVQFLRDRFNYYFPDDFVEFVKVEDLDIDSLRLREEDSNKIIVFTTLLNPILDMDLLRDMIELAKSKEMKICAKGGVPGTEPLAVFRGSEVSNVGRVFLYSGMQRRYNSQLNIARLRRLKLFVALLNKIPDLFKKSLVEILDYLSSKVGTNFVVGYGEDIELESLAKCPLCVGEYFSPIYADVGQPLTGFLTRDSEYYFLCHDCGLVFANPIMPEKELWRYYDRYSYDVEWNESSLSAHYENMGYLNTSHYYNYVAVLPYLEQLPKNAVCVDLGGGDGEFVVFLRQNFSNFEISLWDYRISTLIQSCLKPWRIDTCQVNFLNETLGSNELDMVTNWEVIEHLPVAKLEAYFKRVYDSLKEGGLYLFSTPDFESAYCHALDFWAITPGEHLSVLSRRVLEPILLRCGFKIIGEHHECVALKTHDRWYKYGAECNSTMASRGAAVIINDVLRDEDVLNSHLDYLRKNNLGSELILCCQK